ncbi:MAG TPA: rhamnulokinase family protein [Terriglobales bacterium]|nr:rhamnulokinase family protein [Terriglobales bacterium]
MPEVSKPYLAFDLGAESGRAVLAHVHAGVITTEEVHRFTNEPVEYGGALHWDLPRLWLEMCKTLSKLEEVQLGGIGVDAWGVDYALLGERGELLQNPYHYRDKRTDGVMQSVFARIPKEEIYRETGIQFMQINTLYQLFAAKRDTPDLLRAARKLVTIPDLFHYWLTGNAVCEFTNATTTQMVNPCTRSWARGLIEKLGLPGELPGEIVEPGSTVGMLSRKIGSSAAMSGTPVIAPASHDTGSAVAAVVARDGTAFLSSGTWSLVGTELDRPIITDESLKLNFTNEGGVCGTTRFLKNVMGLWMLQCCRQAWKAQSQVYDYRELMEVAEREPAFAHLVDPDEESFLHPENMPEAIDRFCAKTQQAKPASPGAYARTVIESLAFKYRQVLDDLERVMCKRIDQIRVIGGGSKNRLLNQFTADAAGRRVLAGPAEATALGNIAMQMLATGAASSLKEVREVVARSFPTEVYEPRETDKWERHAARFQHYTEMVYA